MSRYALWIACLLMGTAASLGAQTDSARAAGDGADVLVLDHDFTATGEFVRVFLQNGQVYRAELSSPSVTLAIKAVGRETEQLPNVYAFLPSETPSGSSILEIYPRRDAEYEIRAVMAETRPTRLRLYRDIDASRRREVVRGTPGWEVGLEMAGGWHSGFAQSSAPAPAGTDSPAGTDIEACFTARGSPGLTMCVLGVSYQSQHRTPDLAWVYTEPRVRILGRVRPGLSNWDGGVLFRFGVGINSMSSTAPMLLGPGVYVARHIRTNRRKASWSFQLSYIRASFPGFNRPYYISESVTPKSHRLSFGIGWYQ
jgi:hypothetical protein